jgi:hypothetical protein
MWWTQIFTSWNQMAAWLRQIEGLRRAGLTRVTADATSRKLELGGQSMAALD